MPSKRAGANQKRAPAITGPLAAEKYNYCAQVFWLAEENGFSHLFVFVSFDLMQTCKKYSLTFLKSP